MSIFSHKGQSPTKINTIRINQAVLGYPMPVVMGTGRVQQSLIWKDGFIAHKESASGGGGKGITGGKGGSFYDYTANVIAALCNGPVSSIGDVWSGQTWLSHSNTTEAFTIPSHGIYTPTNATSLTVDGGVGASNAYSSTQSDFNSPSSTVLSGTDFYPLTQVASLGSLA